MSAPTYHPTPLRPPPARWARWGLLPLALAVTVSLAACTGADQGGGAGGAADRNVIAMKNDNKYTPETLEVARGTTVTWDNVSAVQHTVTVDASKANDPSHVALPPGVAPFDSGFIDPGKKWSHTFDTPGTYKYFCIPHESVGMIGTLIVK
jgi:plastocyanin